MMKVYYDSPETEREIKSAPGLIEFITLCINNLGLKYSATPELIFFMPLRYSEGLALQVWKHIQISPKVAGLWIRDRRAMERALKHMLTHEYRHFLFTARYEEIPLPVGPEWEEARKEWLEICIKEFTEKETGITEIETVNLLVDLIRSYG